MPEVSDRSTQYTATSLRLGEETLEAYREAAKAQGKDTSEVLREALKLWVIQANLKAPKALAIVDRSQAVKRGGEVFVKAECEVVLTSD
jgi:predicted DNA-binding protein